MCDMATQQPSLPPATQQPPLPLAEITAWYTRQGAAERIGISVRTLDRWRDTQKIKAYRPHGARDEVVPVLFYAVDVEEMAKAQKLLSGPNKDPRPNA